MSEEISAHEYVSAAFYLRYFGHLASGDTQQVDISTGVASFQEMAGLIPHGRLDRATLKAMQWPRCACKDVERIETSEAVQRVWRKRSLTYRIDGYVSRLASSVQDAAWERCFAGWTRHIDFTVKRVAVGDADLVISSGRGAAFGFDGPAGTLAWCELPPGDDRPLRLMCDDAENWTMAGTQAMDILFQNVINHEVGHFFGLTHSQRQSALMFFAYNPRIVDPQPDDDIPRVQGLYGPRPTPPPAPSPSREVWKGVLEPGTYTLTKAS